MPGRYALLRLDGLSLPTGTRKCIKFVARAVAGQDVALFVVDASVSDTSGPRALLDTEEGLLHEHAWVAS